MLLVMTVAGIPVDVVSVDAMFEQIQYVFTLVIGLSLFSLVRLS